MKSRIILSIFDIICALALILNFAGSTEISVIFYIFKIYFFLVLYSP